ncbi:MAG: hypothetical protein AB1690_13235 [Candidatus Zixiibacteriota bacterium]
MTGENRARYIILAAFLLLIIIGHILFAQFADYSYLSSRHIQDLFRAKFWSFFLVLAVSLAIYFLRHKTYTPLLAVLGVSVYFIIIYSILYRGTQYGLNGHWGDNGYRLATTSKISAYGYLADAYLKDLPTMYPPLWFAFMAIYSKLVGIEVWQTLKYGYLVLFLLYPWLVYFSWKPLVTRGTAAAVAVATLFFASDLINYTYYEHLACALFVPWWLYFFEDASGKSSGRQYNWRFILLGSAIGSLLFLTYYYWFYLAIAAFPLGLAVKFLEHRSWSLLWHDIRQKLFIALGILLFTSIYWLPLLLSAFKNGFESYQLKWFHLDYINFAIGWRENLLRALFILAGIFMAGYLWDRWKQARLILLYAGAILLILIDRLANLGQFSIQTRKILEFAHVLTMAPVAIGFAVFWSKLSDRKNIRWGCLAIVATFAMIIANNQTEIPKNNLYKSGVNQRVPTIDLKPVEMVDCRGKVLLTSKYIESIYLPYFMFIPVNNASAHLAGEFKERKTFLEIASQLRHPELFAYALTQNRFDKVDYIYLPHNQAAAGYELRFNLIDFNRTSIPDTILFPEYLLSDTGYFKRIGTDGIFEVVSPPLTTAITERLRENHPQISSYLKRNSR